MNPAATPISPVLRPPRLAGFAWLLLPLTAHFTLSWIGFNPTDDGWMQAVARRIADGEIPHRDFIFVRPALSALLQVPLVWFGGEHVIWLSRLWGWVTIAAVAWIWSGFAQPGTIPLRVRYPLYAAAFFLCVHVFPIMAWHSIDGLLLGTGAVWFAARGHLRTAFILAGLAALCRQNFAVFAPVLLLAIPDRGKWRAMWWAALPPALYLGTMLVFGALRDFIQQATATGGAFKDVAWEHFITNPGFVWSIPGGTLAAVLVHHLGRWQKTAGQVVALLIMLLLAGLGGYGLAHTYETFHAVAFSLFGLVGGMALALMVNGSETRDDQLPVVAGYGLAWTVAISLGWNSPALMSGGLLILAWRILHRLLPAETAPKSNWHAAVASLAALVLGWFWWQARHQHPYREAALAELVADPGPVLPGTAGLRTNPRTQAALTDLHQLISECEAKGTPYVLLTDGSAAWIRSKQRNLLPCEWPQGTELGDNPLLIERVLDALRKLPPDTRIFLQRYITSEFSYGLIPMPTDNNYYVVQYWVQAHGRKTGETEYFEIYAPPAAP